MDSGVLAPSQPLRGGQEEGRQPLGDWQSFGLRDPSYTVGGVSPGTGGAEGLRGGPGQGGLPRPHWGKATDVSCFLVAWQLKAQSLCGYVGVASEQRVPLPAHKHWDPSGAQHRQRWTCSPGFA